MNLIHSATGFLALPFLTLLAGCGGDGAAADDDDGSEPTCTIQGEISGAVSASLSGKDDLGCGLPFGADQGVETVFTLPGGSIGSFDLQIMDVREKETGSFDATVSIQVKDNGPRYSTNLCSVTIEKNEYQKDNDDGTFVTREYLIAGKGTCSASLQASDGTTVDVAAFTFVTLSLWK